MSNLYFRIPSKAIEEANPQKFLPWQYAAIGNDGTVVSAGERPLSEMRTQVTNAQKIVLIIAANDVTLLRVKVPAIPKAKLKLALPNLIEDQLVGNPEDNVIVPGDIVDGILTVAVIDKARLDGLMQKVIDLGGRRISAVPAQLCLPHDNDTVHASVTEHARNVDLAANLSAKESLGLAVITEQDIHADEDAIANLVALVPKSKIVLKVPEARVEAYQAILSAHCEESRFSVVADAAKDWTALANQSGFDLLRGTNKPSLPTVNWRTWRLPIALGASLLVLNLISLNLDWWQMKSEAKEIRASMFETYKTAFPNEKLIVDPLAQLRQKVGAQLRESGNVSPDDFLALSAALTEAWNAAAARPADIALIEYGKRSLLVHLKPGASVQFDSVRTALATKNLTLSQANTNIWMVGSSK